jgi:hypothetical protein
MAEPTASSRQPHPARRARKIVATASVAALCGLGGFMAARSTAGGATTTDHGSADRGRGTTTDDGLQGSNQYQYQDGWGAPTDPWGSGDRWGAQGAPGGSTSPSNGSSRAPDSSSHAS